MIYKSLRFKIILIFFLFIICIIAIIGTIMFNNVFRFYTNEFKLQMDAFFSGDFLSELESVMAEEKYYNSMREILKAHLGNLGINNSRNFYILNMDGNILAGTNDEEYGLANTPNMLAAMNRRRGTEQIFGADYMDYAIYLSNGSKECIVYIKDTEEEMKKFTWNLFTVIIQSLIISLVIAVILSFFLANAISSPIKNITKGALKLSEGEFEKQLDVISNDEIGVLTNTFNNMADNLKSKIEEASGEREKLETIFLHLKDGVFTFSADGSLIHMNPQGVGIMENSFDYDNDFNDFRKMLGIGADETIIHDVTYNSRIYDINMGKFRYKEDNKTKTGIIAVMQDITQRYDLEKTRREFIANVSHELKTPLTSIKAYTETLIENTDISPEQELDLLNVILGESDRMTRIVRELLDILIIDNKKMIWQFAETDVSAMARKIYLAMQSEAKSRNHEFILKTDENLIALEIDKEKIEQVLLNIISNAFKYSNEYENITFEVRNHKQNGEITGIEFKVADTGIGIPQEDLTHIFERFYRVDKSRSTEGTGLGLSIAKEIVHAHKGEIMIKSEVGKGTVVTVILYKTSKDENNEE